MPHLPDITVEFSRSQTKKRGILNHQHFKRLILLHCATQPSIQKFVGFKTDFITAFTTSSFLSANIPKGCYPPPHKMTPQPGQQPDYHVGDDVGANYIEGAVTSDARSLQEIMSDKAV
jgi:hypothetical protein